MDKISSTSLNIEKENIEKLKELFPNAVTEGKINFDMLKADLGDEIDNNIEKYQFTWPGKKEAIKIAQTPSSATLRPDKSSSKDWDTTENIYIEGDNLEVLKQLQKTYYGKIKMIYIDPPYNTGKDFVYRDNFKNSIDNYKEQTNQIAKSNPETNGRFHTDWLNMMYPRIILAKNLLSNDGVIFMSIDDNEVDNLRKISDEIFGEQNFIGLFPRITKKSGKSHSETIAKNNDYILIYSKSYLDIEFNGVEFDETGFDNRDEYYNERGNYKLNQTLDYDSLWYNPAMDFEIEIDGTIYVPGGDMELHLQRHKGNHKTKDWVWRWSKQKFDFGYKNGFVVVKQGIDRLRIYTKTYERATISKNESGYYVENIDRKNTISSLKFVDNKYSNDNAKKELAKLEMGSDFDFPKPTTLITELLKLVDTNEEFYVLDFFSGSGTTCESVMQYNVDYNRNIKYIAVQLPEKTNNNYGNLCKIGEERIRRAGNLLKQAYESNHNKGSLFAGDDEFSVDTGFKVFKLDSSNIVEWDDSIKLEEKELSNRLREIFKKDRSKEDILYEIMLKYGVFDKKVEEISINNKTMYNIKYEKKNIVICLDDVDENDIKEIGKLQPTDVIFNEAGFKDDNAKINAVYNLNKAGVKEVKCI